MNKFKDIPVWENKRRLGLLIDFRKQVMIYFENSEPGRDLLQPRQETTLSVEARRHINLKRQEAHKIIADTMVPFIFQWQPPPNSGKTGYANIDLIQNMFDLGQFQIPTARVVDVIDQAIGVYESDQRKSLIRIFNPIWWTGLALKWVANLPFWMLATAGFEEQKIVASLSARIAKLIFLAIPVTAAILEILDLLDWLDTVKKIWE